MKNTAHLSNFSIVLVEPSHPGNIGAAARAMKTMGFTRLMLVKPKQFPHPDATAFASGAADVLDNATVTADLASTIASAQRVIGVSARLRDVPMPCVTPRAFANSQQVTNLSTAIIFGNEQSGLSNDDLARCHQQIRIPTAPDYGSLNLAQAVQIVCYELAQAYACDDALSSVKQQTGGSAEDSPAPQQDFDGMFAHWCDVLEASHYLHPQQRQKMLLRMRQLWLRTHPTAAEITMLRGAFRNILRHMGESRG